MSDIFTLITRAVNWWRESKHKPTDAPDLGYLSQSSYEYWMARAERERRNGTTRDDFSQ